MEVAECSDAGCNTGRHKLRRRQVVLTEGMHKAVHRPSQHCNHPTTLA